MIDEDPSATVAARPTPTARQHAPWTRDDLAAFRAKWPHDTPQRLAFELIYWTGARISDAVRMGDGMVDHEGWLHFRQQKTGGDVWIPFRRDLPEFVDPADLDHLHAALDARPVRHITWMTTATGKSRSVKSASQWFSAAARAAGLANRTAHGLRVTRAIALAELGATTHQIGAWTGHASLKEIEHYSRASNKRRLLSGPERERRIVQNLKS